MKFLVVSVLFAVVAAKTYYYTVKDDLDVDAFIADPKKINDFIDCFVDRGPCTELAQSYKDIIKKSLEQRCVRCSSKLKKQYLRFLQGTQKIYPERYYEYRRFYDAENKYFDDLEKDLSKYA